MEELLTLPGVARKTANVVLGSWFKKNEGVVVDTHVTRISIRLEEDDDFVTVTIVNDGEPLPEGFDPAQTASLGLRIVTDLVRGGLGGAFTMENRDGITAVVKFPRQ